MKQRELIDLLADHADALNRRADHDVSEWLANDGLLANASSILVLLQLAQAVKRALVPVTLSPLFQSELKRRLLYEERVALEKRPFPKTLLLGAAVSVIGLAIYLLRRFRPVGGVVTAV
jgi:hypothetical protein